MTPAARLFLFAIAAGWLAFLAWAIPQARKEGTPWPEIIGDAGLWFFSAIAAACLASACLP